MRLFDLDGPFMQAINSIGNVFLLNLCFLLCCIPVITIGAASTALYAVFLVEKDDSWVVFRFFKAFKNNFKQGTILFLLVAAVGGLLLANFFYLSAYDIAGSGAIYICLYAVAFFYVSVTVFSFGLLSRYRNTLWQTIKNAAILTVGMFLPAAMIVAVTILPVLLLLLDVDLFLWSVLLWLLAGFAVSARFNAFLLKRIFAKISSEKSSDAA